jgi:hypothetical protein
LRGDGYPKKTLKIDKKSWSEPQINREKPYEIAMNILTFYANFSISLGKKFDIKIMFLLTSLLRGWIVVSQAGWHFSGAGSL